MNFSSPDEAKIQKIIEIYKHAKSTKPPTEELALKYTLRVYAKTLERDDTARHSLIQGVEQNLKPEFAHNIRMLILNICVFEDALKGGLFQVDEHAEKCKKWTKIIDDACKEILNENEGQMSMTSQPFSKQTKALFADKDFRVVITWVGLFFLVITLTGFFLAVTDPGKVVVDEHGNIDGWTNEWRASLQGDRFWKAQISAIDNQITFNQQFPNIDRMMTKTDARNEKRMIRDVMEKVYQKYPEQRLTDRMRDVADKIKEEADNRELRAELWRENVSLQKIRAIVDRRITQK